MGVPPPGHSPALVARINEKRAELENLKQLKELSGNLADQMEALEAKLSTLSDGTQAVAAVLANWHNVLQAINMASSMIFVQPLIFSLLNFGSESRRCCGTPK